MPMNEENLKNYLSPHTTHECQPLDTSFFRSLKSHWQDFCHRFYQTNPGKVITKLNFNLVFKPAWESAATPANLVNGFKKCGIYPFNPLQYRLSLIQVSLYI